MNDNTDLEERIEIVSGLVSSFAEETRNMRYEDMRFDREPTLADLFADLMHFTDRDGLNVEHILAQAREHYERDKT